MLFEGADPGVERILGLLSGGFCFTDPDCEPDPGDLDDDRDFGDFDAAPGAHAGRSAPGDGVDAATGVNVGTAFDPDPDSLAVPAGVVDLSVPLSVGERVGLVVGLEAQKAVLDARVARQLAALDVADSSGRHIVVEEVAAALRLSDSTARGRLKTARTLVEDLPTTLRLLASGRVSWRHAQTIVAASWTLPDDRVAWFEDRVCDRAPDQTVAELARSVRREVLRVDPDGAHRRHTLARTGRFARRYPGEDGMAELRIYAPAPEIDAAYTRIDAYARQQRALTHHQPTPTPSDTNGSSTDGPAAVAAELVSVELVSLEQRRADAALAAIMAGIDTADLPATAQGSTAGAVQVMMPLSSLLGVDDEPGYLHGYGHIPAALARRIAAHPDSTWTRLLTDPVTGGLLDYGRTCYRPPADLRDYVIARDVTCVFPGCQQPAYFGDLDHIREWDADHGTTCPENLAPLCKRHHKLKTEHHWTYRAVINPDRSRGWTWTSPTGRTYPTQPPPLWPHPNDKPNPEQTISDPTDVDDAWDSATDTDRTNGRTSDSTADQVTRIRERAATRTTDPDTNPDTNPDTPKITYAQWIERPPDRLAQPPGPRPTKPKQPAKKSRSSTAMTTNAADSDSDADDLPPY
jgi:hypothetical protein